jgi:uncharacterized membrane protein
MSRWGAVKRSFIAGLVLIAPLLLTLYILQILSGFALQFIDPVVQGTNLSEYTRDVELVARILAVAVIVFAVTLLGFLAQRPLGQRLFGSLGRVVSVIPLVRVIYSTVRQLASSFSSTETSYDSLVLVEFPRKGIYAIGLVTSESPTAVNEVAGSPARNVFLPSSPNPASGRLVMVPEDQLHEVDLSVRQGMRMLMTTGIGVDDDQLSVPGLIDVPIEEIETGGGPRSENADEESDETRDDQN